MSQADTVALFINEVSTGGQAGGLEEAVGNLTGVQSVEVSKSEQHGMGPSPSLVKKAVITYDPDATNPQALRADLEDLGYAVTVVGDQA